MQTLGICSCALASFSVPCVFMLQYIPQSPGFAAKSSGSATCQALNMRGPQSGWLRCLSHSLRRQNPQLLKPPSLLHCPGSCLSHSEITNTSRSFTTAKVALITGASGITGAAVLEYDSAAFEHLAKHTTTHFLQPLVPFKIILLAKYLSTSSGMILRKYIYLNLA